MKREDFRDMALAYFRKAASQNVRHAEIFFDPQTHTSRGISFETVIRGLRDAQDEAQRTLNVSSKLILCFLRHLDEEDALRTLDEALPFREWIVAVGLDSSEQGNPPSKFERVFTRAREVYRIRDPTLRQLLERGVKVTINSDDPAYFGGYINENYIAVAEALNLTREQIEQIARNSFAASF